MGRKLAVEIRKQFSENEDKNQKCGLCETILSGNNVTNMTRHLKSKHSDVYLKIEISLTGAKSIISKPKGQKITVHASEEMIWEGIIEMATSGGLPLCFIKSSGFQKILSPMTDKMVIEKSFNLPNLKSKIDETAAKIKSDIKKNVCNNMVSLKVDAVTRHNRSLLGINIQYVANDEICIKTIGVKELYAKHTGNYLKQVIQKTLKEYDISLNQIYTITSDNGRNMIKSTSLLRNELQNDIQGNIEEDESDESFDGDNETQISHYSTTLQDVQKMMQIDSDSLINCIRCAAHTLQLVVADSIKEENLAGKILKCRKLAIALRKPTNTTKLKLLNLKLAKLSVPTRWNSNFDMIERLLEIKSFCIENQNEDSDMETNNDLWDFMSEFVAVFTPVKVATLQLQNKQMTLGDFYMHWLRLKIDLSKMKSTPMTNTILNFIKVREKVLLNDIVVITALYLDPRFNFMLSKTQRIDAQNHLKKIYANLNFLESLNKENELLATSSSNTNNNNESIMSANSNLSEQDDVLNYLNDIERELTSERISDIVKIHKEIENYSPERIKDLNINVLHYWKVKESELPILSKLAKIVQSVPATQVSVERSFSTLHWILADERNQIGANVLENILMVKLNQNCN